MQQWAIAGQLHGALVLLGGSSPVSVFSLSSRSAIFASYWLLQLLEKASAESLCSLIMVALTAASCTPNFWCSRANMHTGAHA